ncbi:unnamed protein product [Phytomonas sp. EM1]|nr:unnamed protein product [Phytomonas sp. EM1]|eukprot:CCW65636.1 unnamed protein product [Phytomonas sp. isolate EM1]
MFANSLDQGNCQRYSPGVLIGNWFEEMCVERDKLKLYQTRKQMSAPQSQAALQYLETSTLLSGTPSGPVRFGAPLLLLNAQAKCALALDLSPLMMTSSDKAPVTGMQSCASQLRSTWVLERCTDDNNVAYNKSFKEPMELHYGQRIRICNECASDKGFYYLQSQLASGRYSSEKQLVVASMNACADNVFVVCRPCAKREATHEGEVVNVGDPIVLLHSITNSPLCCDHTLQRTSYGMEYSISCGYATTRHTRVQEAVAVNGENLFYFSYGSSDEKSKTKATRRLTVTMASTMPVTCGDEVDKIMNRIREGAVYYGGRVGLRAISRSLGVACNERCSTFLSRTQLDDLVSRLGVRLRPIELDVVIKKLDTHGTNLIRVQDFVAELRGNLNAVRLQAVTEAYQKLIMEGRGSVQFESMYRLYCHNAPLHPDVQDGLITREEAIFDFESSWPAAFRHKMGTVTLEEFIDYYTDISPATLEDGRFVQIVQNCWEIPETNAYLTQKNYHLVKVIHKNGTTESIPLPASCQVDLTDQKALKSMLIQHGVHDIVDVSVSTRGS